MRRKWYCGGLCDTAVTESAQSLRWGETSALGHVSTYQLKSPLKGGTIQALVA